MYIGVFQGMFEVQNWGFEDTGISIFGDELGGDLRAFWGLKLS